jgi:hypothetical protein
VFQTNSLACAPATSWQEFSSIALVGVEQKVMLNVRYTFRMEALSGAPSSLLPIWGQAFLTCKQSLKAALELLYPNV